jgi:hypothetical protein
MEALVAFLTSAAANLFSWLFTGSDGPSAEIKQEFKEGTGNAAMNYGTINNTTNNFNEALERAFKFKKDDNNSIKKTARLLFVDDQDQGSTIRHLKKLGWENVEQLAIGEVMNTDCEKYRFADIIFVDYDQIGPPKKGQGLSILSSLRAKYGITKYYILHTAHPAKITLQKLQESGIPISDTVGWSQLTKGSADYLLETTILNGIRQIRI